MFKPTALFFFLFLMVGLAKGQVLDTAFTTAKIDTTALKQIYPKPERFGFITHTPVDLWQLTKSPFQKSNFKGVALVAASTGLLIWQDQHLLDAAQNFGRFIELKPDVGFNNILKAGSTRLVKIPKNLNTGLYQLGEGGTSMYIAAGLFIYGKFEHDNRSLQTASDLTESFFATGIATQILKRVSGRQTPSSSTVDGGYWSVFPSFKAFQNDKPNFDSFPSGHLTTMMATVTVLAENYPEKKWIKPVGYSLIGLTGLAMLNNGVHWAGDYPLAIAMGYLTGKIITNRHLKNHLSFR
ncbi:phosphatase PAP2 family protein [Pedobacter sp. SD-b]|uniref:Phosphatase PAP2 family protein n=1 Tax=Pedobacter segetis TaxID=2793069 RepID=A0ABS1BLJ8_9SPHI|nr:phosphatase PAP2 family protein [Pedobacter segetis]MBK0383186.1 phosphatase PAP2 family protein [Pedobacter segetis]